MRLDVVWPAARSVAWPQVGGLVALGVVPIAINSPRAHPNLGAAVVAVVVLCGVTVAGAAGEPSRDVLDATAAGSHRRAASRLLAVSAVSGTVGAAAVAVARWRDPAAVTSAWSRVAELVAVAGVALALASVADRRRADSPALAGALGSLLMVLVSSALAVRVRRLPSVGVDGHAPRWWVIGTLAWGAALWSARDPYRVGRARSGGRPRTG